jgi:hypothetical protein
MGWGICIEQDATGCVLCNDADFETRPEDYKNCPPSGYDFVYEEVESRHSEIDMARDEMGVRSACVQCHEAFEDALESYRRLPEEEKTRLHKEYVRNINEEIKSCVVDTLKKKEKEYQIEFFKLKWGPVLGKLEADIAWLEKELTDKKAVYDKKRGPLSLLEEDLETIVKPAALKKALQARLRFENNQFAGSP